MTASTPRFWHGWRERAASLRNIPALMLLVWQSGPGIVAAGWIFRIAGALIPVAMLTVAKWILDAVQVKTGGGPLPSAFWFWVALEGGLAVLGGVLGRVTGFFDGLLADRFTRHVSVRVMEHAARLDLTAYESPAFHDRLERARVQATDRIAMIHAIGALAQQMIIVVSLSVSVMFFSPWLLLLLVVAVVPAFIGESHFAFLGYSLNVQQTPVRRQLDYLRVLGASKETAKELKLFGLAGYITGQYRELSDGIYDQNVALARRRLVVGSLLSLVSTGSYYSAYAYVIFRTVNGDLSWGSLQFIAGSIAGASANIQSMFATFSNIADQSLFLTDLVEFFREKPTLASATHPIPAPRPINDGFVFDKVSFHYPGNPRPILQDLDFRVAPGERIALVGENGQGKTTLVKLITRLYDPTGGRILLDGVDLRDYDVEDLHREIGVIFQDFVRYEMSARENIAVGRLDAVDDEWRIRKAAGRSLAHDVIKRLPAGYDQRLGRRFDGGVDLSGGEWQKVALARAYLRDAQLLILDEPTAALDARAELEVFERFAELTAGKMALLISHRFSTVRMADRIVVLSDGQITEDGRHDNLVASGGRYARMFERQAASYR